MFTLMQNVYQQQSINFASKIQDQFTSRVNRFDRGVRQAGFLVLYMTTMPSVLIELGFITNPAEVRFLNSAEGQDYMASAVFRACREYINEIERRSGISAIREGEEIIVTPAAAISTPPTTTATVATSQTIIDDIVFMVQIISSTSKIEMQPANFKGINNIYEIVENNRFKYASGRFATFSEAVEYRKTIERTYSDAFIIAVQNNKTISLQQAIEQTKK
jgi:N-acetylmuramoyl-L-alanine amidase